MDHLYMVVFGGSHEVPAPILEGTLEVGNLVFATRTS
jgi:hypothetical protein